MRVERRIHQKSFIALFSIVALLFAVILNAHAQVKVYKVVNADGSISFSDKPVAGAKEIEMSVTTTNIQSQQSPASTALPNTAQEPKINYKLSITSPEPEATIRDNNGKVTITSRISPQIKGRYILTLSGQEHRSQSGVFNLEGINRGEHQYSVKFIDNKGKLIASSEQRTLYLHQASILIRRNVN